MTFFKLCIMSEIRKTENAGISEILHESFQVMTTFIDILL